MKKVTLWQLFCVFAKIGVFTIGGGYAMIPIISDELVKRKWIAEEEFPDIIALSQTAPGIIAVNISIFLGHKLRGLRGSVAATLGAVLPSFAIIFLLAVLFTGYQDNPTVVKVFKGIRPVVVSLILVPMVGMARKCDKSWWSWTITFLVLFLVVFIGLSPIWILLGLAVLSALLSLRRIGKGVGNG